MMIRIIGLWVMMFWVFTAQAVDRYVALDGGHVAPFISWEDAATNIQDAIDASVAGDTVWVTNGLYNTGGKVMAGDLTNRVALDKAVTLQSVNGSEVTTIQGAWHPTSTNGLTAVRCAWLTNGATLNGFTLTGGATRTVGDVATLQRGGGVWCASSEAVVSECRIVGNAAFNGGGGVFQGTINECIISGNWAGSGGGVYSSMVGGLVVHRSRITENSANTGGGVFGAPPAVMISNSLISENRAVQGAVGGVSGGTLVNCTVTKNFAQAVIGGVQSSVLTNCIVVLNSDNSLNPSGVNHVNSTFSFSCSTPLPAGPGNLSVDPQFLDDGFHLSATSPCRGMGTNIVGGLDIDGQPWAAPPSIGCDEWQPEPVAEILPFSPIVGMHGRIAVALSVAGESPFGFAWSRDGQSVSDGPAVSGSQTSTLQLDVSNPTMAGAYQAVVTNAYGSANSSMVPVGLHFADAASRGALPPYTNWATAAASIQEAIDGAGVGEIVVVTNGIYDDGGRVMSSPLTNRVVLDKALMVMSACGPEETVIQGAWDPINTNGPLAIRCAWLADGATLHGFTLRDGATLAGGANADGGGGVFSASRSAMVSECLITNNSASVYGGGVCYGTIDRCEVSGNRSARFGGGVHEVTAKQCTIRDNFAYLSGGGISSVTAFGSRIINSWITSNTARVDGGAAHAGYLDNGVTATNCSITGNTAGSRAGGVYRGSFVNCIIWGNYAPNATNQTGAALEYSCSTQIYSGIGNIDTDPLLLADGVHLSEASPCRAAGTNLTTGVDIDGQPWANPPSMGYDQWQPEPVAGAPFAQATANIGEVALLVSVTGEEPFTCFWSKNGLPIEEDAHYGAVQTTRMLVHEFGPADAGSYQVVVSNVFGVSVSQIAQVDVHCVAAAGVNPVPPFTSWETAATNIQNAIDTAAIGDVVVVSNGVYSTGGKAMAGDLTNRIVLDKAISVMSVNGPEVTVIKGNWDTGVTNGPTSVRGVWMGSGAILSGFAVRDGATRPITLPVTDQMNGGGVWGASSKAMVLNCLIHSNAASYEGGGAYGVTLVNCRLQSNIARSLGTPGSGFSNGGRGGGGAQCKLENCQISNNLALNDAGGVFGCELRNCALTGNKVYFFGSAAYQCALLNCTVSDSYSFGYNPYSAAVEDSFVTNCIVVNNYRKVRSFGATNINNCTVGYSCTVPIAIGEGNIDADPLFMDSVHVAVASPCWGMGSPGSADGVDVDGEPWLNPPSMGCDEVHEADLVGPLSVSIEVAETNVVQGVPLFLAGLIGGRGSSLSWDFGDGLIGTNVSYITSHSWTNSGKYTITFTAYNVDNPSGVSASMNVAVIPLELPELIATGYANTSFSLQFVSQKGVSYVVEQTTNLVPPVAWSIIKALTGRGGLEQVSDASATNDMRFYRVRIP